MTEKTLLDKIEIFKYLDAAERDLILKETREVNFADGELVFRANSIGNEMFIIKSGKIKIHKIFDGVELNFAEFGAGDAFGEMSLIDEYPRSASAQAIGPTALLTFSSEQFKNLIKAQTVLGVKLLRAIAEVFSKRMRKTDKLLETYYLVNKALIQNEEFRQLYTAIHT